MSDAETGLRERKKAKTRTAIQRHALRLFGTRGYHETTIEQVAEAAEVAPSTVFRYFPTKEDLAVLDDYFPLAGAFREAFAAQPRELRPIHAFRIALRESFQSLPPDERAARYERDLLLVTVPELWAANTGLLSKGRQTLREAFATRAGRPPDDAGVRAAVDAIVGIALGVLFDWTKNRQADPAAALDDALAQLEAGLPL